MEYASGQRRRDGRTRDTRQRIQEVALELFVAQGFSRTSLQDIADRLGLTKAAIYYHFASKSDLVRSVVQPAIDDTDAFLETAQRESMSPRQLLEGFFDLNYAHRLLFLALLRDPSGLADAEAQDWVPRMAEQFQALIAGPDADAEERIRTLMVVTGLSRSATLLTADIPREELRATSVDVACEVLGISRGASG